MIRSRRRAGPASVNDVTGHGLDASQTQTPGDHWQADRSLGVPTSGGARLRCDRAPRGTVRTPPTRITACSRPARDPPPPDPSGGDHPTGRRRRMRRRRSGRPGGRWTVGGSLRPSARWRYRASAS
jgi:hypothetical protein